MKGWNRVTSGQVRTESKKTGRSSTMVQKYPRKANRRILFFLYRKIGEPRARGSRTLTKSVVRSKT